MADLWFLLLSCRHWQRERRNAPPLAGTMVPCRECAEHTPAADGTRPRDVYRATLYVMRPDAPGAPVQVIA